MATCSSCGAEIVWVTMSTGKRMPLDPKKYTVVVADGEGKDARVVTGQQSHFASCPKADAHRRTS